MRECRELSLSRDREAFSIVSRGKRGHADCFHSIFYDIRTDLETEHPRNRPRQTIDRFQSVSTKYPISETQTIVIARWMIENVVSLISFSNIQLYIYIRIFHVLSVIFRSYFFWQFLNSSLDELLKYSHKIFDYCFGNFE